MNKANQAQTLEQIIFEILLESYRRSSKMKSISIRDHVLIEYIGHKKHATMSELAKALGAPATTMTSIVDRLVKEGYLQRRRSEEDGRIVLVELGKKGQLYYKTHLEEGHALMAGIMEDLSGEELEVVLGLFARIRDKLLSA